MATCIVCNASFDHGGCCPRCDSDNRTWMRWVANEPVEQGGLRGMLAFARPHFWIPFIIAGLSGFAGLIAMFTVWQGVRPGFRLLAVLVTPLGCLVALQGVYEARLAIREYEMLYRVRRGWSRGISLESVTLFFPTIAAATIAILPNLLVMVESLWFMIGWWVLVETPQLGASWPERFLSVLPFVFLVGYIILPISLTVSSSMMLAQNYASRLNRFLPYPIFLQEDLLVEVVQREAARVVNKPFVTEVSGSGALPNGAQPARENWLWTEMARTDGGGVRLKAVAQAGSNVEQSPTGWQSERTPQATYTVEADAWGRVQSVTREEGES